MKTRQIPKLVPAIKWLKEADIVGVYATALRCQVWALLPPTPETRQLAMDDLKRLRGGMNTKGKAKFLYNYYTTTKDPDSVDHSVSQYGVLGMWVCAQMGLEVSTSYWQDVEDRWVYDQQPNGGWIYGDIPNPTYPDPQLSITAAGVATLYITQDYVHAAEGIRCAGNVQNAHIDAGLKWIGEHQKEWAPASNWVGLWFPGYNLYALAGIGVASGLKYIGGVDWYQFGADWCLAAAIRRRRHQW